MYNLEIILEPNGVSAHKIGRHVPDDYDQLSGRNIEIFYSKVSLCNRTLAIFFSLFLQKYEPFFQRAS